MSKKNSSNVKASAICRTECTDVVLAWCLTKSNALRRIHLLICRFALQKGCTAQHFTDVMLQNVVMQNFYLVLELQYRKCLMSNRAKFSYQHLTFNCNICSQSTHRTSISLSSINPFTRCLWMGCSLSWGSIGKSKTDIAVESTYPNRRRWQKVMKRKEQWNQQMMANI